MRGLLRRLRGALGNALVWGVSWAGASFAFWATWILTGTGAVPVKEPWVVLGVSTLSAGISGVVTGLLFSGYLGIAHRSGGVLEIRVGRSAIVGGLVAVAVPILTNAAWMLATVSVVPLDILALGAVTPAVLGAATAGGTVFAARRAALHARNEATAELEAEQEEVGRLLEA